MATLTGNEPISSANLKAVVAPILSRLAAIESRITALESNQGGGGTSPSDSVTLYEGEGTRTVVCYGTDPTQFARIVFTSTRGDSSLTLTGPHLGSQNVSGIGEVNITQTQSNRWTIDWSTTFVYCTEVVGYYY